MCDRGSRVERIRRHYEERVTPQRETFDILDWGSRESQRKRFEVLASLLGACHCRSRPPILLDVGCGMADLAEYLDARGCAIRYIGADITLGILREARRRTPSRRLVLADVFVAPPFGPRAADVCYCSGVFNLQLGNNDAFVRRALPRLVDLAAEFAVANLLHARTARKYEHCHYYDPGAIVASMEQQGIRVRLIDDYLENDFTLVLSKP
ncbi:MAG: class I SAM-dependent methyltransferase [Lentisphaeria bacterium]|nr:class I SAM-dependent methyltransferase [Lentisphaeria bacterium]